MVSTRNTSRSNANPPRMQDPPGDADSRPPGTVEAMQANTNEVEALHLVNQRLIEELEQLTRQMQHPRETRQTQELHKSCYSINGNNIKISSHGLITIQAIHFESPKQSHTNHVNSKTLGSALFTTTIGIFFTRFKYFETENTAIQA